MKHVVVAISDPYLLKHLTAAIADEYRTVTPAADGIEAIRAVFDTRPDAAIVDLGITGIDSFELIKMLRAAADLAILALAPSADADAVVQALEMGADDVARYGTSPEEIVARLRASERRIGRSGRRPGGQAVPSIVQTGQLRIDREARQVLKNGEPISLTRTEYRLLDTLAARVGQVVPHRFLLSTVWGDAYVDDTHYLRMYVAYLRAKLEEDPKRPRYLISEWGVGYMLASLPVEDIEAPAPAPARREEPAESVGSGNGTPSQS